MQPKKKPKNFVLGSIFPMKWMSKIYIALKTPK